MDREDFLTNFEQVRARTMGVVRAIPADKVEWTCRQGEFTLGDLVRHIAATERYVFAECANGRPSRYKGCGRDLADGLDNVIAFMERMHAESMEIFRRMTDEDFLKKGTSPEGKPVTAWRMLRAMLEHETHHRGQMYVYLGILGIPAPSLYGLKEQQVKALSAKP
ncbi:MAG: DinB family protein [Candidatus Acidiferrales bacterium]